jgi:hypothetical protein
VPGEVPTLAFNFNSSIKEEAAGGHQWYGFQAGIAAEASPASLVDSSVVETLGDRGRTVLSFMAHEAIALTPPEAEPMPAEVAA